MVDRSNSSGNNWSPLATKVWTTKSARFNATRRLEAQYRTSAQTLAFLSIYLIVLQCWLALDTGINSAQNDVVWSLLSIGMALLILVLGLLEQNKQYRVRADRLMRSAMELNELTDRIAADEEAEPDVGSLEERTKEYHAILKRTAENHENIDYEMLKTQSDDFDVKWTRVPVIKIRYWLRTYAWYTAIVAPWLVVWWRV